jgi:predicted CopG family antitoxin
LSNDTILETNTNSTSGKKNITVSAETYDRLVSIGKFSDRTFDHLIRRLLDERDGKENISGGND